MKQIVVWLWAASLVLPGVCRAAPVGGVYLHNDTLAQQVDSIDTAVQGATTLKPYDDQLANLTAFAAKEDLAVATRLGAERDAELQQLIGQVHDDRQDARPALLVKEACQELANVVQLISPSASTPSAAPCDVSQHPGQLNSSWLEGNAHLVLFIEQEAQAQAAVKVATQRFARLYPSLPAPDCSGAATEENKADVKVIPNAVNDLQDLGVLCTRVTVQEDQLKSRGWSPAETSTGGQVMQAYGADQKDADTAASAALKLLQTQLDAVQKDAKAKTNLSVLQQIEGELQTALSTTDPVVKIAKLTIVIDSLDQVEAALACKTTCTNPPTESVGTKAVAVIGLMNALAQSSDVAAGRGAVSNWVAAAQAIVAAYTADAQTDAAADAAMTAMTTQREMLAANEVTLLSKAVLLASGDFADGGMPGCAAATAFECALPAYIDSWNLGRAPAAVLGYRQVQVFRAFIVQRQRQAAQAQRSLLLAATATLKAYGDGGIQPQAIAQFIGALGIVGIAAK